MTDARVPAQALVRQLLTSRTPAERLRMCARMFASARILALAGIKAQSGTIDNAEQRRSIFLRFYGHEFSDRERKAILAAIEGSAD